MKAIRIGWLAGALGCAVALQVPQAAARSGEAVAHAFRAKDGYYPSGNVLDVNGMLYSTTGAGGANCKYQEFESCGTVFGLDPKTGGYKVIYSFCSQSNCTDGAGPTSGLIDGKGILYGTTDEGGANTASCQGVGCGTAFALNPQTGAESVLYSFCSQANCADGQDPQGGLLDVKGTLYGLTQFGGAYGAGVAFALDPGSGAETVLHSFGNGTDGAFPQAALIDVSGMLYGVTLGGGADSTDCTGCGTVFSLNPKTGAETVLYSFCRRLFCKDGKWPLASPIEVNGTLYGTTYYGGTSTSCGGTLGCGTVFALDASTGKERVVNSFCTAQNCADGEFPVSDVIGVNGSLYGTANVGGADNGGVAFAVDPKSGAETVVYSFCNRQNCGDGVGPEAGLLNVNGTLYGTTVAGGGHCPSPGCGTVYALKLH